MSDKQTKPIIKTWQFFHACKSILGQTLLTDLFKKSPRQICRWSCDPDYTESSQKNPIDKYEVLLKKLMEIGKTDIARSSVHRQASIVGCILTQIVTIPDKDTLEAELLDDLPAFTDYQVAVRKDLDEITVRDLLSEAKRELDETFLAFIRNKISK